MYAKRRRRVGVDGGTAPGIAEDEAEALEDEEGKAGRVGDGGESSLCRMAPKMALACSFWASDSEGMMRDFEGVEGPPGLLASSRRWYDVRRSPESFEGTNLSPYLRGLEPPAPPPPPAEIVNGVEEGLSSLLAVAFWRRRPKGECFIERRRCKCSHGIYS